MCARDKTSGWLLLLLECLLLWPELMLLFNTLCMCCGTYLEKPAIHKRQEAAAVAVPSYILLIESSTTRRSGEGMTLVAILYWQLLISNSHISQRVKIPVTGMVLFLSFWHFSNIIIIILLFYKSSAMCYIYVLCGARPCDVVAANREEQRN